MSYQTERDEFIAKATAEGLPVYVVRTILARATTLQKISELSCSSEAADRDRVKCPADPSRKYGRDECICDAPEGEHCDVPRIDVQEQRIRKELRKLVENRKIWRVVNTWNGGEGGRKVCFITSNQDELMPWFHANTSFSMDEAIAHQGYLVEETGFKFNFQGDPRGAVVKLAVPSGAYDDLGKEGLCVPARGLPASYWERH